MLLVRDLSSISRGDRGEVENRGGSLILEPFKREGYEKMTRKKGRSQKIKPP